MSLAVEVGGLVLADPWFLLAALAVPLALVRRGRGASIAFAPAPLLLDARAGPPIPRRLRARLAGLPRLLEAAGLLLLAVALARPAERVPVPRTVEGIDVVLCLDVSSSMSAKDMERGRTRLEIAREAAARFVEGRPHDRVGLVTFARYPDLRCPPTLDHRALAALLAAVAPVEEDGPEDATGVGAAAAKAVQVLSAGRAASRVAILLTDGEENVAEPDAPGEIDPVHAAQLCERLGVRVHAVVAGGAGAASDARRVADLARATGGAWLRAEDAGTMRDVYARIDALETTPFREPLEALEDRFLPFLLAAVGLLLVGRLLGASALEVLP